MLKMLSQQLFMDHPISRANKGKYSRQSYPDILSRLMKSFRVGKFGV